MASKSIKQKAANAQRRLSGEAFSYVGGKRQDIMIAQYAKSKQRKSDLRRVARAG